MGAKPNPIAAKCRITELFMGYFVKLCKKEKASMDKKVFL